MKVPIACTLSADDAADRVGEWRTAFGATVTGMSRPAPGLAVLRLLADPQRVATLVDLARREKTCCEFFSFTFEVEADGVRLVIGVPDDAVAVLDDFAALASQHGPPDETPHIGDSASSFSRRP